MISTDLFVRHFLAIYFVIVGLHYTAQSYALSERTGFTHIGYGERYSKAWWGRHVFNFFRAGILVICLARIFFDIDSWLGIISILYRPWILGAGVFTLLLSFVIIDYVHSYMHQDWRSGMVPTQTNQQLITTGPFSRSRNPLFIGIIVGQAGFFLALPSLFSLLCLVTGMTVVINQARMEESALRAQFGEKYEAYQISSPRWF